MNNQGLMNCKFYEAAKFFFLSSDWEALYSLKNRTDQDDISENGKVFALISAACFQLTRDEEANLFAEKAIKSGERGFLGLVLMSSLNFNLAVSHKHLNNNEYLNKYFSDFLSFWFDETSAHSLMSNNKFLSSRARNNLLTEIDFSENQESNFILTEMHNKLDKLVNKLHKEKESMLLMGVKAFNNKDPFLSGKVAMGISHLIERYRNDLTKVKFYTSIFKEIMTNLKDEDIKTWGISFYLQALRKVDSLGYLSKVIDTKDLATLIQKLDWRTFIDPITLESKIKSNNFYGVAFSIADTRHYFGWDDAKHTNHIMQKMLLHYKNFSDEYGFADETEGKGRFDRYSFLLVAEIAHVFREAGLPITKKLKDNLRNSAEYVLHNLNVRGDGFMFGRSIGAYGDTAFLEILTAASWFGLLTKDEEKAAFIFSKLCSEKFLNYWWDKDEGSVNLWTKGRQTDSYRSIDRILGENFSLLHHHIYTQKLWSNLGYKDCDYDEVFLEKWIKRKPSYLMTWFSKKNGFERVVFTWRKESFLFNLPLVNGDVYYNQSNYLPTPYSCCGLNPIPNTTFSQLVPKIKLKSGEVLMPLCNFKNIQCSESEGISNVTWCNEPLINTAGKSPKNYDDISINTEFSFSNGGISRRDIVLGNIQEIESINLEWYDFPELKIPIDNKHDIKFISSPFSSIELKGYKLKNSVETMLAISVIDTQHSEEIVLGWKLNFSK